MTSDHPAPLPIRLKSDQVLNKTGLVSVDRSAAVDEVALEQGLPCRWDKTVHKRHYGGTNPSHRRRSGFSTSVVARVG